MAVYRGAASSVGVSFVLWFVLESLAHGRAGTTLLLAFVFCFNFVLDCSFCWILGVSGCFCFPHATHTVFFHCRGAKSGGPLLLCDGCAVLPCPVNAVVVPHACAHRHAWLQTEADAGLLRGRQDKPGNAQELTQTATSNLIQGPTRCRRYHI